MSVQNTIDVADPRFKADPFPLLARLRAQEPVHRSRLRDKTPIWLLTRHPDVLALLQDDRFAKRRASTLSADQPARRPWVPAMFRPLERNMLDLDPPDHTRLRRLVQGAFTPRLVEQMRDRVESVSDDLLETAASKGEMDVIRDYALPLPMTIISEILGVPARDRHRFHRWSSVIVSVGSSRDVWRAIPSLWRFTRYLKTLFRLRRSSPKDDLVSALIRAEEGHDRLSEDELLAMVFLLLIAGHETTVNLIGSGTLELLRHPDQKERLQSDPTLIRAAVEELLRYTAPVFLSTERYAREAVTISGVTIPRGGLTYGVIGSANRDATVFDEPDALDLGRQNNKHLSFGQGIHYCLGAPLARLEAQVALGTLFQRLPNLRLKGRQESLRWRRSLVLRGLETLPVEF